MNLSRSARTLIIVLVAVGVLGYAVVVEFGVSAGRVHQGVSVAGLDVGGLTLTDTAEALTERGELLRTEPILFVAEGMTRCLIPIEIGWGPQAFATAEAAMDVGRKGGPVKAVRDRVKAWIGGFRVRWVGGADWHKVTAVIDAWEEQATSLGLELRRYRLRRRIRNAIVTWPRRPFEIPVRHSVGVGEGVGEGDGSEVVLSPSDDEVSELAPSSCDNLG